MEMESLNHFLKKAITHYDNQNLKYYDFIKSQNATVNLKDNEISFFLNDDKTFNSDIEILGYFDNRTNIWIWGWMLTGLLNTNISRDLLNYGLKLEIGLTNTNEHFFIKSLLVNSRILVEDDIQLEINFAIYSYLMKDRYKFLYPWKKYLDKEKTIYITHYYLIK